MEPAWEKYYSRLRGHIQEAIDNVIVDNIIPHIRLTNNVDVSLDGLLKSGAYDKAIFNLVNVCISELKDAYYKSSGNTITSSTVYSDSFDEMVQKDFTYKGDRYTWNDSDCVYYNDNGDEDDFFMEIPEGAITSSKAIKSDYLPIEKWCKLFDMNNINDIWNITDIVNETTGGGRCLPSYDISHEEFLRAYNKYKGITSSKKPVKGMTKPEGEILREVEDDVGCLIQLVKLTNGKYLVTDNWQTEDICDNLKEANIKFNEYFM